MSLWVDKYKPKSLDQLTYHADLSKHLQKLANSESFPHMMFYGQPGAGKKTRIAAVLRELFGPGVERIKVEPRQFLTSTNKKLNFTAVSSNYHLELNPSDLGIYDRVIVQDVIKSIAQSQQIDASAKHQFKVVVIDKADELTREAQAALRRTMEKYTTNMRLILCCNSLSKIIPPVRSRCLLIRVSRPEVDEVAGTLLNVATKEDIKLPKKLATDIAIHSAKNMRASLLALESTAVRHSDLTKVTQMDDLDWEVTISLIVNAILKEQTPNSLLAIRPLLYELIVKYIEPTVILKKITFGLLKKIDNSLKPKIVEKAAYHEHRMQIGAKQIIHLEAFVASVMSVYKRFSEGF
ncbi:DNA clamp loader [Sporodiniella umbellata]|nr:DNA clamp loader [Sporodiniella umbellata]